MWPAEPRGLFLALPKDPLDAFQVDLVGMWAVVERAVGFAQVGDAVAAMIAFRLRAMNSTLAAMRALSMEGARGSAWIRGSMKWARGRTYRPLNE